VQCIAVHCSALQRVTDEWVDDDDENKRLAVYTSIDLTRASTHAHTHTHKHTFPLSLSLSLTLTHTHTIQENRLIVLFTVSEALFPL